MEKNISFLFGAGLSIPAGLPSTTEISKKILSGDFLELKTNRNNCLLNFIRIIKKKVEATLKKNRINYEDLYYVILQLKEFQWEYQNPVVISFIDDIITELMAKDIIEKSINKNHLRKKVFELADQALNYFNFIIVKCLAREKLTNTYLSFLKDIYNSKYITNLNIITLNHDTLLEEYFMEEGLDFYDGFVNYPSNTSVRKWEGNFKEASQKIKLFKLHGSINWYCCQQSSRDSDYSNFFLARDTKKIEEFFDKSDSGKEIAIKAETTPMILAGRYNKILEYNRGIYVDLHYNFYRLLGKTEEIIISGYSFNDLGINSWLIDWLDSSKKHKIYLIHPDPMACMASARPGIQEQYTKWQQDKFINLKIPIQQFSWQKYSHLII